MKDFFLVAKVIAPDKEGFVKIVTYSDFPERFRNLKKAYINLFDEKKLLFIEKIVEKEKRISLKFKNFDSEEDIGFLIGKEIFVDNEDLIKLPEDYYFIHDLIGSIVLKDDVEIGFIEDVLTYPANDVYVIEQKNGEELLIPAIKDYIENFDPVKKKLVLKSGIDFYEDDED